MMTHTNLIRVQEILYQETACIDPNDVPSLIAVIAENCAPITCDCGGRLPHFDTDEARCPECHLIHCIG
jgi:hypothetical protein